MMKVDQIKNGGTKRSEKNNEEKEVEGEQIKVKQI